jgi:hypothetical protein
VIPPDVDEPQLALHPSGEQASLWNGITGDSASEAAAQPDGGLIGGVFRASYANFLSNPPWIHSGKKDRERDKEKGSERGI